MSSPLLWSIRSRSNRTSCPRHPGDFLLLRLIANGPILLCVWLLIEKVMNNMCELMQGPKLRWRVETKKPTHQQLERTECLSSPTSRKKVGKLFSRLKLSGRQDYAGLEIFILQTGGEGESIVRSDWLHDEKKRRTELPQWFPSSASRDLLGLLFHRFVVVWQVRSTRVNPLLLHSNVCEHDSKV